MASDMKDYNRAWTATRQRLEALEHRLAGNFAASPDEIEARLQSRTRAWAAEPIVECDDWLEVFVFTLSGETYAVGSQHLGEVVRLNQFTPLPGTPAWLPGIVSVRGRVVTIVDLRVLFELPVSGLADRNSLAVLQGPEMEFGLLVDRVLGIQRIQRRAIQQEIANLTGIRAAYLLGVTREQWTVLDGERLLGDPNMRLIIE